MITVSDTRGVLKKIYMLSTMSEDLKTFMNNQDANSEYPEVTRNAARLKRETKKQVSIGRDFLSVGRQGIESVPDLTAILVPVNSLLSTTVGGLAYTASQEVHLQMVVDIFGKSIRDATDVSSTVFRDLGENPDLPTLERWAWDNSFNNRFPGKFLIVNSYIGTSDSIRYVKAHTIDNPLKGGLASIVFQTYRYTDGSFGLGCARINCTEGWQQLCDAFGATLPATVIQDEWSYGGPVLRMKVGTALATMGSDFYVLPIGTGITVGMMHVLGGPEFVLGWTAFAAEPIVVDETNESLTLELVELCMDWEGKMIKDIEVDPDLRARADDLTGQIVRSSVFTSMKTVPSSLIPRLQLEGMARNADDSIDGEILFSAVPEDDLGAVTFARAASLAQGRRYTALHSFTINPVEVQRHIVDVGLTSGLTGSVDAIEWRDDNRANVSNTVITFNGNSVDTSSWTYTVTISGLEQPDIDSVEMAVLWSNGAAVVNNITGVANADVVTHIVGFLPPIYSQGESYEQEVSDFDEPTFFVNRSVRPWELPDNKMAGFFLLHYGRQRSQLTKPVSSFITMGNIVASNLKGITVTDAI